ncbi:hypothetical protein [Streptomyces sp. NPDC058326]
MPGGAERVRRAALHAWIGDPAAPGRPTVFRAASRRPRGNRVGPPPPSV